MKKNRWFLRAVVLVVLSVMLNATVTVAGAVAGGSDDPLVTLSYLNDTFLGEILNKVDEKIGRKEQSDCPAAWWDNGEFYVQYVYCSDSYQRTSPDGRNWLRGHASGWRCRLRCILQPGTD